MADKNPREYVKELLKKVFGSRTEAHKVLKLGYDLSSLSRMQDWPEQKFLDLIDKLLKHHSENPDRFTNDQVIWLQTYSKRHGTSDIGEIRFAGALDGRFTSLVDDLISSIKEKTDALGLRGQVYAFLGSLQPYEQFRHGSYVHRKLVCCEFGESSIIGAVLKEVEGVIRSAMKSLTDDKTPKGRTCLAQTVADMVGEVTGVQVDVTSNKNLIDWYEANRDLASKLVPGRSRLSHLNWPTPYAQDWVFEGSEHFKRIFGSSTEYLDAECYLAYAQTFPDNGQSSAPGLPRHGFFRPSAFLFDARPDATHTLYTRSVQFEPKPLYPHASSRLHVVIPRLLISAVESGRLVYDSYVAVADVSTTHVNKTVIVRHETYARALSGSISIGLDGYTKDGSWDFDGLQPIAEDGRWLLLRSSHASKPIKVSVLCITSDSKLCFTLQEPHLIYDTPNWAPTFVHFAIPRDFNDKRDLVSAIQTTAKRLIERRLSDLESNKIRVVGFALDAGAGLQPNYFCLAKVKYSEEELRSLLDGTPLRFHPLIDDNPAVSVAEAYSLGRYSECDLLRASLFAAWRWITDFRQNDSEYYPSLHEIFSGSVPETSRSRKSSPSSSSAEHVESPTVTAAANFEHHAPVNDKK